MFTFNAELIVRAEVMCTVQAMPNCTVPPARTAFANALAEQFLRIMLGLICIDWSRGPCDDTAGPTEGSRPTRSRKTMRVAARTVRREIPHVDVTEGTFSADTGWAYLNRRARRRPEPIR
jgi:hypothetical protein